MNYQWEIEAQKKIDEIKPFIDRIDGHWLNEILSSYRGYSHSAFVARFLDLFMAEVKGVKKFVGSEIVLDSTTPEDEIRFILNGKVIGKINGITR